MVIYERIKDEVRKGKTFRSATASGWDRAKETVVTGNMVTLIGAVIIYFLAVGDVKGFAFTMGLTTVFDLLVTFLVTAPLLILASRSKFWGRPSVSGMSKAFATANRKKDTDTDKDTDTARTKAAESTGSTVVEVGGGSVDKQLAPTRDDSEEK